MLDRGRRSGLGLSYTAHMRQALKNLTYSEHSEWFGLGPLALAVLAGIRALMAEESFGRGVWTAIALLMLLLCAIYVIWTRRRGSSQSPREPGGGLG